jgi:hypothetical protein
MAVANELFNNPGQGIGGAVQLCIMKPNRASLQSEANFRSTLLNPSWSFVLVLGRCLLRYKNHFI